MYRVGYTPWEHPGPAWSSSLTQWLDREELDGDVELVDYQDYH